ncbi:thymidine phosphorylase, partial [candidate division WOR-3 bacterium]|nr:thymidine phosphorylase [candidate division WOR-3 bacterium]
AMIESGEVIDLQNIQGFKIDKHSTGGVGDKISIPLAPLVASTGIAVPMISGRSLGHTGGTLDKLESIPGFNTSLTTDEFKYQISQIGVAIMGQTEVMTPADKKMYALRDVTATVESIPLITASIMCKKIAEGIDGLVLDVKYGNGAFMKTIGDARALANKMVKLGNLMNKKTTAFITNMNQPIGEKIGNTLEIEESIDILKGKGPEDTKNLILQLGAEMLVLGRITSTTDEAIRILKEKIKNGDALNKFRQMIEAQGGNSKVINNYSIMPHAQYIVQVAAEKEGYVKGIDAFGIGNMIANIGGGRIKITDRIDHSIGIELFKKIGNKVESGDLIANLHIRNIEDGSEIRELFGSFFEISETPVNQSPLIEEIIR